MSRPRFYALMALLLWDAHIDYMRETLLSINFVHIKGFQNPSQIYKNVTKQSSFLNEFDKLGKCAKSC